MFFVVDIPNNGQDVLEIMVNKPNRERQKLMREQNILKQVLSLSRVLYMPQAQIEALPGCRSDRLLVSLCADLQAAASSVHGQRRRTDAATGGAG